MTEGRKGDIDALIASAHASYAARLPGKVAEIAAFAARGDWPEVRRAAHKLSGSAKTYGFGAVGTAARAIESILLESQDEPPANGELATLIDRARADAAKAAGEGA
jgi:HPt (histidine-containing phosphotransfer) domain-containing protein